MVILTEHSGGTGVPQIIGQEFLRGYRKLIKARNSQLMTPNTHQEQEAMPDFLDTTTNETLFSA